jgi:hypothetical protein
MTLNLLEERYE